MAHTHKREEIPLDGGENEDKKSASSQDKPIGDRIRDLQHEAHRGFIGLLLSMVAIICGGCCCLWIVASVFLAILPFMMTIYGGIYWNDCPAKPFIPQFLVIGGVVGLISSCCRSKEDKKKKNLIGYLLDVCWLIWFICGAVAVYKIYKPNYEEQESLDYCHPTLYKFSFFLITLVLVCIGVVVIIGVCLSCVALVLLCNHKSKQTQESQC